MHSEYMNTECMYACIYLVPVWSSLHQTQRSTITQLFPRFCMADQVCLCTISILVYICLYDFMLHIYIAYSQTKYVQSGFYKSLIISNGWLLHLVIRTKDAGSKTSIIIFQNFFACFLYYPCFLLSKCHYSDLGF